MLHLEQLLLVLLLGQLTFLATHRLTVGIGNWDWLLPGLNFTAFPGHVLLDLAVRGLVFLLGIH